MTLINDHRTVINCTAYIGSDPLSAVQDANEVLMFATDWMAFGPPIKSNGVDTTGYVQFLIQYSNVLVTHPAWALRKHKGYTVLSASTGLDLALLIKDKCADGHWVPFSLVWVDPITTDYSIMMVEYDGINIVQ
jgi:hypothetical protein